MKRTRLARRTPLKRKGFGLKRKHKLQFTRGLRPTALRKVSDTRRKQLAQYAKLRRELLSTFDFCQFGRLESDKISPLCWRSPVDVHHRKGRHGELLFDPRWVICLCHWHHDWVHAHANEARRLGYLLT